VSASGMQYLRPVVGFSILSLVVLGCSGGRGGGGGGGDPKLAADLTVAEVAVFQGVKISVAKDDLLVATRNAPVVAGREALVRVYVTPGAAYVPRPLSAELHIDDQVYTDMRTITTASTDASLASTFQFTVPVGKIASTSTFAVAILDPAGTETAKGTPSTARFPGDGTQASLSAVRTGQVNVMLVPFAYGGDGSNRLPDTTDAQIERYRAAMYETYPTTAINITVHDPVAFNQVFDSGGNGFDNLNQIVAQVRSNDRANDDTYYYGIIAPARSFGSYCGQGCVTGLSYVVERAKDADLRVGSGIGFTGGDSAQTFIHEVGHQHGRYHAPCQVTDADPNYPYSRGVTGDWGYSVLSSKLFPPTDTDFMSYCDTNWISDYTYNALALRLNAVNTLAGTLGGASVGLQNYQLVTVGADGSLTPGLIVAMHPLTSTNRRPVHLVEGGGRSRSVEATLVPHGHGGGSTLFVPVAGPTPTMEMLGRTITF